MATSRVANRLAQKAKTKSFRNSIDAVKNKNAVYPKPTKINDIIDTSPNIIKRGNRDKSIVSATERYNNIKEAGEVKSKASFRSSVDAVKNKNAVYPKPAEINDVVSTSPNIINRGRKTGPSASKRYSDFEEASRQRDVDSFKGSIGRARNKTVSPEDIPSTYKPQGSLIRRGTSHHTGHVNNSSTPVYTRKGEVPDAVKIQGNVKPFNPKTATGTKGLINNIASSTPMKVVAGASVGSLIIGNMTRSKGQQSNSELYGQRTPYM